MKPKILVRGPCLTQSGYGEHTRMIIRALRTREADYDIFVVPVGWGQTGWQHEDTEERKWFDKIINKTKMAIANKVVFDVSLQVSIPNEWQQLAPINVGVTAGIETTKVAYPWIEVGNNMDKIIITSQHSKNVYTDTVYNATSPDGVEVQMRLNTPVEVISYPAKGVKEKPLPIKLKHDFNYIFVGQWGPRKNIDNMIKWWLEENWSEQVGLVLKVSHAKNNLYDKKHTMRRIKSICDSMSLDPEDRECKVYLIHGDLTEQEMNALYNHKKIKCMVSITHGEGYGLPLFDFAQTGKPIVATEWSGHLDFLTSKNEKGKMTNHFLPVSYSMVPIPDHVVWDNVLIQGSMWAEPHEGSFKHRIRQVRKNKKWIERSQKNVERLMKDFSEEKIYSQVCNVIDDCMNKTQDLSAMAL